MPHSFKQFWDQFRGRCFILRRCRLIYITPERLQSLMEMAYRRGGVDSLIAQGEADIDLIDKVRKEIEADNLHREYRQSVTRPHFLSDGAPPLHDTPAELV